MNLTTDHNFSPTQARRAHKLIEHEQELGHYTDHVSELWDRIGVGSTGRAYFYQQSQHEPVPHVSRT